MTLKVENVSVAYLANSRPVIDNLSLSADSGKVTSILGPTGSGKTTLILAIAGLLNPKEARVSGRIESNGRTLRLPLDWSLPISIVFQQPTFFPWLTILDNIVSLHDSQARRSRPHAEIVDRARKCLASVGLAGSANLRPYQLSGGMQARANLARALSFGSDLVLLDEPFANLDEIMKERVASVVSHHAAEMRTTTIIVTHNIRDAVRISRSIYILSGEPLDTATLWQRPGETGDLEEMHDEVRAMCEKQWYRHK